MVCGGVPDIRRGELVAIEDVAGRRALRRVVLLLEADADVRLHRHRSAWCDDASSSNQKGVVQ
ncbi:hypothetical protein [Actinomyces oricola]